MSENPVRVSDTTRERLRLAAAITGKTQQEIVDEAVEEYVVRRPEEWQAGLEAARKALMEGTAAEYLAGVDVPRLPEERLVRSDGPFSDVSGVKQRGRGG